MDIDIEIAEIEDFWTRNFAFYLNEHRNPVNRTTHMIGIPILIVTTLAAIIMLDWRMFVGGQLLGWALQLAGHKIEGNKPALLKNPSAWLMGPLVVLVEMLGGLGLHFGFTEKARKLIFTESV